MTQAGFTKRLLAAIDKDIDGQVEEGRKKGASSLEISLLDKVLRPYAKIMEMQKHVRGDPEEFVDATFWILAVLTVECTLNTTDKHNSDQVYAQVNTKMKDYAISVAQMLEASVPRPKPH